MKLKTNKTLTKGQRRKNKNQKNKDRIGKNNIWKIIIERLNWNKNKNFRKRLRTKIKNQKNNEWNWNTKINRATHSLFQVGERKEGKKDHRWQTIHYLLSWAIPGVRGYNDDFNDAVEGQV